jgi:hypothetical protein
MRSRVWALLRPHRESLLCSLVRDRSRRYLYAVSEHPRSKRDSLTEGSLADGDEFRMN